MATNMEIPQNKLHLAMLRLASELHSEKLVKYQEREVDKLLWKYHKIYLEFAKNLEKLSELLLSTHTRQQKDEFKRHVEQIKEHLTENKLETDVVQKLVLQLKSTGHNVTLDQTEWIKMQQLSEDVLQHMDYIIDNTNSAYNEKLLQLMVKLNEQVLAISEKVGDLQQRIRSACHESLEVSANMLHDIQ